MPYPIITAIGVDGDHQCVPGLNGAQFDFHPYEYGSWDSGVSVLAAKKYMGTNMSNGAAVVSDRSANGICVVRHDNLGYFLGTSSDILAGACEVIPSSNDTSTNDLLGLARLLEEIVGHTHTSTFQDLSGLYPSPFKNYNRSSLVSNNDLLTLVDGSLSQQSHPIWPFIRPDREVDVLIVNDNSADAASNHPNGSEIYNTYIQAKVDGLSKMPLIPPVSTFLAQGLDERATFSGCNETDTVFIVYLPNKDYSYNSGQSTFRFQYSESETDAITTNGNQTAI